MNIMMNICDQIFYSRVSTTKDYVLVVMGGSNMNDSWNAFVSENLKINPTGSGRLNGTTFAVKDVFEIQDYKNTAGNPDWYRTHQPAKQHAPVINTLLNQGAFLKGTTHTDELMYSLNGENFHYGTPVNPRAKDRIPGGSSSGSAVAVAAGLVDFALGTDTGGSVRIPSSYCGIYGFRPTHGFVNITGVIPLARSFDTVGWMARDPELLLHIGEALIPSDHTRNEEFNHFFLDEECWSLAEEDTKAILQNVTAILRTMSDFIQEIKVSVEGLSVWADAFRTIQGIEIYKEHGEWIKKENPLFGPGIRERFAWTSTLDKEQLELKNKIRENVKNDLSNILKENRLLVIPTAPGEAPLLDLPGSQLEQYRSRTMQLTCIAGLSGFPQITIPLASKNGVPIGLSFIANQYQDLKLLKWVNRFVQLFEDKRILNPF